MADRTTRITAALAGSIDIGGELSVNRFGFGAMRLTGPGIWGEPEDREECKRVLRRGLALGIKPIDTPGPYGPAGSEAPISETPLLPPHHLVVASKCGSRPPPPH